MCNYNKEKRKIKMLCFIVRFLLAIIYNDVIIILYCIAQIANTL